MNANLRENGSTNYAFGLVLLGMGKVGHPLGLNERREWGSGVGPRREQAHGVSFISFRFSFLISFFIFESKFKSNTFKLKFKFIQTRIMLQYAMHKQTLISTNPLSKEKIALNV